MLTADDARALVAEAKSGDRAAAEAMLASWHRAIEYHARHAKTSVRESSVSRPRMNVSSAAHEMVFESLRNAGFEVSTVPDGPNESTVQVSW